MKYIPRFLPIVSELTFIEDAAIASEVHAPASAGVLLGILAGARRGRGDGKVAVTEGDAPIVAVIAADLLLVLRPIAWRAPSKASDGRGGIPVPAVFTPHAQQRPSPTKSVTLALMSAPLARLCSRSSRAFIGSVLYLKGVLVSRYIDNYQNFAKAFKVREFHSLMGDQRANHARLKSAAEFGRAEMSEGSALYQSVPRAVLYAVMELVTDVDSNEALAHLTLNIPNYYGDMTRHDLAVELADYLAKRLEYPAARRSQSGLSALRAGEEPEIG